MDAQQNTLSITTRDCKYTMNSSESYIARGMGLKCAIKSSQDKENINFENQRETPKGGRPQFYNHRYGVNLPL